MPVTGLDRIVLASIVFLVSLLPALATPRVDPWIPQQLADVGTADIFIKVATDADLHEAERIVDRVERAGYVYDTLTRHAEITQHGLREMLRARGIPHDTFWINNSLFVRDADAELLRLLAERDDVAHIRGDHPVSRLRPEREIEGRAAERAIEWNVAIIGADDVWATGNTGEGIVVANIDTGVRYTHEALVDQYRGNNGDGSFDHDYSWWDPNGNLGAPGDNVGHGTHTMGTMVGGDGPGPFGNDIGVAPGARWIAAKGCAGIVCSQSSLISAAQWIICPTRVDGTDPDCSKAPHVVNNSWAGIGGDDWYQPLVNAWLQAGIQPVFGLGNSGPSCNSAGSPADYRNVIGVGGSDIDDSAYDSSSRGPGILAPLKPNVVAPGESVRSAENGSDVAYGVMSGTSMAAPHVAGTIALMLSANPDLTTLEIRQALSQTAVQSLLAPPAPQSCAGRPFDVYPNVIYGWGRIDAAAAVAASP
jgi:hypothetical protein